MEPNLKAVAGAHEYVVVIDRPNSQTIEWHMRSDKKHREFTDAIEERIAAGKPIILTDEGERVLIFPCPGISVMVLTEDAAKKRASRMRQMQMAGGLIQPPGRH